MSADTPALTWSLSGPPDAPVVALAGELDVATSPLLRPELEDLMTSAAELTVDLDGLSFIDSVGLKVLLSAQRTANDGDCRLTFQRPQPAVRRLLDITGTDGFFTFKD